MESSLSSLNTVLNISSSFTPHKINKLPLMECLSFKQRKRLNSQRVSCVKLESSDFERKQDAEMNPDWMMELGKLQDKCCQGKGGMVEMMECLEKEAIMGQDEGKEPTDYHRRAQIFDKSSRVFQALKEHEHNVQSS
ncbi:hypothetical protein M5689_002357 [Euphorbia peplus]|nr:hypothetical protein M5689_002357 [Euphorbia peplus]